LYRVMDGQFFANRQLLTWLKGTHLQDEGLGLKIYDVNDLVRHSLNV